MTDSIRSNNAAVSGSDPADVARALGQLRSTTTIRTRAQALLARARAGQSAHFSIREDALPSCAARVVETTRERYPDLRIPYHSRWRHFEAGGVDRLGQFNGDLGKVSPPKRARAQIDLALVSVLLDAGAGPDWRFTDNRSGQVFGRSEGLGVASFNAFCKGLFSSKPTQPAQADAAGLRAITARQLGEAFQVGKTNPLVGLEGRAALLRRLGDALDAQPQVFGGAGGQCRPGRLFDHLLQASGGHTLAAHDILQALLAALSDIWPAQNMLAAGDGAHIALGDCWQHSALVGASGAGRAGADLQPLTAGWMPFHKLSQWLTYSLLEPFEWAGVEVTGLGELTGLPEYRNGGLLLDAGVIVPVNPALLQTSHQAGDECIVEWRALTVALLDELAPLVRSQLGQTEADMPLACVLEGGTWAAGRTLAQRLRGGLPPLNIESDGTVF